MPWRKRLFLYLVRRMVVRHGTSDMMEIIVEEHMRHFNEDNWFEHESFFDVAIFEARNRAWRLINKMEPPKR